LLALQQVDRHLLSLRAQLDSYPRRLAEVEARVAAAREEVEKSKAAQLATVKDRKKYELDVEQYKERARKYKSQMSEVKTNEAYKALQHETQMAEAEMARAEDRLLEQMVAGEEYDQRIKVTQKALSAAEAVAREERARILEEQTSAQADWSTLEAERVAAVADIPEDLLDHYQRIAKRHDGVALAEVRAEACTMCGVRIRPHVFQEMRMDASTELYHCETCTRILYYVEPPMQAARAAATAAPFPDTPVLESDSNHAGAAKQ
jgi:predicted  nucleic acid-binding Zn-ribbon protein